MKTDLKTDWIIRDKLRERLRDFNWSNFLDSAFDTMMLAAFSVAHMDYFGEEYYEDSPLAYERLHLIAVSYRKLFEQLASVHKELESDSA